MLCSTLTSKKYKGIYKMFKQNFPQKTIYHLLTEHSENVDGHLTPPLRLNKVIKFLLPLVTVIN